MKATLEFDLPAENEEFDRAAKAPDMHLALQDMWEQMFRPRHKHGYDGVHAKVLNDEKYDDAIEALETIYRHILSEYNLNGL